MKSDAQVNVHTALVMFGNLLITKLAFIAIINDISLTS